MSEQKIFLIQPAPTIRDENGFFPHPDMPVFDGGDGKKCKALIAEPGLEVAKVEL
ncbi:hypothetical protein [Pseudomonas viridiflava]|uniref:hypothetical protein n=1 Tax=Pseudomonas viridiflava TaxID=33069 RepID=UPI003BAAE8A9